MRTRCTKPHTQMGFLIIILCFFSSSSSSSLADRTPGSPEATHAAAAQDPGSSRSGALPEGASSDWRSRAQHQIADAEYEVTWQERPLVAGLPASWHAPNRAHDLRTYFTDEGIRVVPRTEANPSWEWGLTLIEDGRGRKRAATDSATLSPDRNRIEYRRRGLTEWYVNDSRGLEQGFTMEAPPEGDEGDTAFISMRLEGTLSAFPTPDGQAIDFMTGAGVRAIHYAELKVTDASGEALPAKFEAFNEGGTRGIRIVFDDSNAVYPVTIDPLATSPAWTAQSLQPVAEYGWSVATAGDVNGDGYDDVIVGAHLYDNGQTDEGRAFVYLGSASGLALFPAWSAESNQISADFGYAVSTAGDVNGDGYADVIIGARHYDYIRSIDVGLAEVFLGSNSGLALSPAWSAIGDQAGSWFGTSVSTAGDVNGDGYSDVIIGAHLDDQGETNEGRAFVYLGAASGLGATPAWSAESNQPGAFFGWSVATAGDVNGDGYADVIVGAYGYDNIQVDEGRAFVYLGSGSGLALSPAWTAESDQADAAFGVSVAGAGDVNGDGYADVIVGAYQYDNVQTDEGRAYVYFGSASGLALTPAWTAESDQALSNFGHTVATAGDVNGDGYADVIVGAEFYSNG